MVSFNYWSIGWSRKSETKDLDSANEDWKKIILNRTLKGKKNYVYVPTLVPQH